MWKCTLQTVYKHKLYIYIIYIYKTWVQYKEGLKFGRYIQFVITMYFIIWMWKLHFVGYDLLYYCYD